MSRCLLPGCPNEAKPGGLYCKATHRAAAHKLRARLGGMLPRERRRARDAAAKRAARAERVIASDVRLAYGKTLDVLTDALEVPLCEGGIEYGEAQAVIAEALNLALPESKRHAA